MSSSLVQPTGTSGTRLAALVALSQRVNEEIAEIVGDPSLTTEISVLPADSLSGFVRILLASVDTASAATTVLLGHVDSGTGRGSGQLVDGRYASTRRFLEVEGRLSAKAASAMVARARDLRGDCAALAEPWLVGSVSSDAVRVIATGVTTAVAHSALSAEDRAVARTAAIELLLPVARVGTVEDVRRAVRHLKLVTDPDGATQSAMEAFDEQALTVEQVGAMTRLAAWLTNETAAAIMTVLSAQVDARRRGGDLAAEEQLPAAADLESFAGRRVSDERHSHLLALALGETFTALLDDDVIGSHHGIAPHVTLTVDVARFEAGLGGDLTMPGSDLPALLCNDSVRRILCDSDITTVVTRSLGRIDTTRDTPVADLLLEASREVLYVGRTRRVVPPRLRRALETRDTHCRFPGCRASVRRCHAHHVREWENGGSTDLDNCVLLCVRHHHAVHEGGWRLSRAEGVPPGGSGYWEFAPPERRRRP